MKELNNEGRFQSKKEKHGDWDRRAILGMECTNEEKIIWKVQLSISFFLNCRNSHIKHQIYFVFVVSFLFLPDSLKSTVKPLQKEAFVSVGLRDSSCGQ